MRAADIEREHISAGKRIVAANMPAVLFFRKIKSPFYAVALDKREHEVFYALIRHINSYNSEELIQIVVPASREAPCSALISKVNRINHAINREGLRTELDRLDLCHFILGNRNICRVNGNALRSIFGKMDSTDIGGIFCFDCIPVFDIYIYRSLRFEFPILRHDLNVEESSQELCLINAVYAECSFRFFYVCVVLFRALPDLFHIQFGTFGDLCFRSVRHRYGIITLFNC